MAIAAALTALPWALSAVHGVKYTNRCREVTPPPPLTPPVALSPCRAAFHSIANDPVLDGSPLPSGCSVEDATMELPSLAPSSSRAFRQLGRAARAYDVSATRPTAAGGAIRVWLDHGIVVAVHLIRPQLSPPWPEIRDVLGAPDGAFEVRSGDRSFDEWVYADRGLAVMALGDDVNLIVLFPPSGVDDYAENLALGIAR